MEKKSKYKNIYNIFLIQKIFVMIKNLGIIKCIYKFILIILLIYDRVSLNYVLFINLFL